MGVACIHLDVHSLNFKAIRELPGTYSRWLVFDSSDISIISIHEIKQQTTDLSLTCLKYRAA